MGILDKIKDAFDGDDEKDKGADLPEPVTADDLLAPSLPPTTAPKTTEEPESGAVFPTDEMFPDQADTPADDGTTDAAGSTESTPAPAPADERDGDKGDREKAQRQREREREQEKAERQREKEKAERQRERADDKPDFISYTVKSGDTLSEIGAKYGVSYQEIARINGIENPDLIFPGQAFKIPRKG